MPEVARDEALRLLTEGALTLHGLIPRASNYTFLGEVTLEGLSTLVVYKPRDGEAPLWDFPDGTLCLREVAAYVASEALGWGIVPMTVLRDGPHGHGAVQLFVEHDPNEHYLTLGPASPYADEFRRIAAFDVVINNADRKSGHCLITPDGVRVVDHGVTFHADPKLRTVIWEFAGEKIAASIAADIRSLGLSLSGSTTFEGLLAPDEVDALRLRIEAFLDAGVYPHPGGRYPYPWPPV